MEYSYIKKFISGSFVLVLSFFYYSMQAQCPSGSTSSGVAYDTTIATPPGVNTLQIKFPKFDPQAGMVNCVRLCISITGVVDSVSVENNSVSPQTAEIYYIRTDQLTGPGLVTPLSNSINYMYGPYALGPSDGTFGTGPDFAAVSRDTLLNAATVCRTLTDSTDLAQFYGLDSVTYTYNISAFTNVSCTGGNYNSTVATSAFVNFHFEYCICSIVLLPLNVQDFFANKIAADKAELTWSGFDDPDKNYKYVVEVSNDGSHYSGIAEIPKNITSNNNVYKYVYTAWDIPSGTRFFRIKQVYSNGYSRFSEIRSVELEGSKFPKFSIYPNPSDGIIGIKFDNNRGGQMMAQVFNSQGQIVLKKEIMTTGSYYWQVGTLQSGIYWLKLTDVTSQLSCVNQLFIK